DPGILADLPGDGIARVQGDQPAPGFLDISHTAKMVEHQGRDPGAQGDGSKSGHPGARPVVDVWRRTVKSQRIAHGRDSRSTCRFQSRFSNEFSSRKLG